MNKKLLMFTLISLTLSILVAPTISVGPQKAEKNPNIMITDAEAELLLPSGGMHSWIADIEMWYIDYEHGISASKAKGLANVATNATLSDIIEVSTNPEAALEAENRWFYISYDVLVDMMVTLGGMSQEEAEAASAMWPQGIYVRFVNVGK